MWNCKSVKAVSVRRSSPYVEHRFVLVRAACTKREESPLPFLNAKYVRVRHFVLVLFLCRASRWNINGYYTRVHDSR